ncbi:hypothetical protein PR048_031441 [Dryococelus australis]|uniref:Uncharacterized protein n=1 Tax=Dryococelus australis TaxID=614101 RepID=A0ABQ9G591_9NEOP|nr:hypothetical protein PR048_031441 [Dryococelus australis]
MVILVDKPSHSLSTNCDCKTSCIHIVTCLCFDLVRALFARSPGTCSASESVTHDYLILNGSFTNDPSLLPSGNRVASPRLQMRYAISLAAHNQSPCPNIGLLYCQHHARLPPRRTGFNLRPGDRICASGNRAGQSCWSAGFLGNLPLSPPSFRRRSIFTTQRNFKLQQRNTNFRNTQVHARKTNNLSTPHLWSVVTWEVVEEGADPRPVDRCVNTPPAKVYGALRLSEVNANQLGDLSTGRGGSNLSADDLLPSFFSTEKKRKRKVIVRRAEARVDTAFSHMRNVESPFDTPYFHPAVSLTFDDVTCFSRLKPKCRLVVTRHVDDVNVPEKISFAKVERTPQPSVYWSFSCVFIGCCPTSGSYGIRKVFPCKSVIGPEACRAGLINCDPVAKRRSSGFSLVESCRTMPLVSGLTRGGRGLAFRRCSILTSLHLIGSQDLDVKSRPNLFTRSLTTTVPQRRIRRPECSPPRQANMPQTGRLDSYRPFTRGLVSFGVSLERRPVFLVCTLHSWLAGLSQPLHHCRSLLPAYLPAWLFLSLLVGRTGHASSGTEYSQSPIERRLGDSGEARDDYSDLRECVGELVWKYLEQFKKVKTAIKTLIEMEMYATWVLHECYQSHASFVQKTKVSQSGELPLRLGSRRQQVGLTFHRLGLRGCDRVFVPSPPSSVAALKERKGEDEPCTQGRWSKVAPPYTYSDISFDRRMNKVMKPMAVLMYHMAEEYAACIQIDVLPKVASLPRGRGAKTARPCQCPRANYFLVSAMRRLSSCRRRGRLRRLSPLRRFVDVKAVHDTANPRYIVSVAFGQSGSVSRFLRRDCVGAGWEIRRSEAAVKCQLKFAPRRVERVCCGDPVVERGLTHSKFHSPGFTPSRPFTPRIPRPRRPALVLSSHPHSARWPSPKTAGRWTAAAYIRAAPSVLIPGILLRLLPASSARWGRGCDARSLVAVSYSRASQKGDQQSSESIVPGRGESRGGSPPQRQTASRRQLQRWFVIRLLAFDVVGDFINCRKNDRFLVASAKDA